MIVQKRPTARCPKPTTVPDCSLPPGLEDWMDTMALGKNSPSVQRPNSSGDMRVTKQSKLGRPTHRQTRLRSRSSAMISIAQNSSPRISSSPMWTDNLSATIRSRARRMSSPFSAHWAASRRSSGQWSHRSPSSSGASGHRPGSHSSSRRSAQCTRNRNDGSSGHSPAKNSRRGPPQTRCPSRRWQPSPQPPGG